MVHVYKCETCTRSKKLYESNLVQLFYFLDAVVAFSEPELQILLFYCEAHLMTCVTHYQSRNLAVFERCLHRWDKKIFFLNKTSQFDHTVELGW